VIQFFFGIEWLLRRFLKIISPTAIRGPYGSFIPPAPMKNPEALLRATPLNFCFLVSVFVFWFRFLFFGFGFWFQFNLYFFGLIFYCTSPPWVCGGAAAVSTPPVAVAGQGSPPLVAIGAGATGVGATGVGATVGDARVA
jgi:hypothetical protein